MAERSKALVLGTSLFGGVGSNPTAANLLNWAPPNVLNIELVNYAIIVRVNPTDVIILKLFNLTVKLKEKWRILQSL